MKLPMPKPALAAMHPWELYSAVLGVEYRQSVEEGLDVERYADLFRAVEALPPRISTPRISWRIPSSG